MCLSLHLPTAALADANNTELGQSTAKTDWVSAIKLHPNLLVEKNNSELQYWKTLELEAEQGFDINISTQGHAPIVEHYDDDFTRVTSSDPYLDLVINASRTLYDFGQSDSLINAERERHLKSKMNYVQVFEKQTHSLFSTLLTHSRNVRTIKELAYGKQQIVKIGQQMAMRFEAGIGTIGDIRRSQLKILTIESQLTMLDNKQRELEFTLLNDYQIQPHQISNLLPIVDTIAGKDVTLDVSLLRSTILSEHERQSIRYQMANISAQAWPQIKSEISATLYDVTRSSSNYQLAGQIRITMPAYDSGYRDAKNASLTHSLLSEDDSFNQLLQIKKNEYQSNLRQKSDLDSTLIELKERQDNLQKQLRSARMALGVTGSDLGGLSAIYQEISNTELSLINSDIDLQQLHLNQLLLTEQLLPVLDVLPELTL